MTARATPRSRSGSPAPAEAGKPHLGVAACPEQHHVTSNKWQCLHPNEVGTSRRAQRCSAPRRAGVRRRPSRAGVVAARRVPEAVGADACPAAAAAEERAQLEAVWSACPALAGAAIPGTGWWTGAVREGAAHTDSRVALGNNGVLITLLGSAAGCSRPGAPARARARVAARAVPGAALQRASASRPAARTRASPATA